MSDIPSFCHYAGSDSIICIDDHYKLLDELNVPVWLIHQTIVEKFRNGFPARLMSVGIGYAS